MREKTWVVYLMARHAKAGLTAVCEQSEWDAMQRDWPGRHTLIRGGIGNEAEAELLARGTAGDARVAPYPSRAPTVANRPLPSRTRPSGTRLG
jgi:hypothetical protein